MADLSKGLPIDHLIGEPLRAVMKANLMAAESARDYIKSLLIDKDGAPNMIDFSFERPGQIYRDEPEAEEPDEGEKTDQNQERKTDRDKDFPPWEIRKETVKISVPMIAVVPIPNLQVDELNLSFDVEVKRATTSKEKEDLIDLIGTVSSPLERTRRTDSSAKYHIDLKATNHGIPEGLARVLDVIVSKIGPHEIKGAETGKSPDVGNGDTAENGADLDNVDKNNSAD